MEKTLITQETAAAIWNAYREIETGKKLLEDMLSAEKEHGHDKTAPALKDAFGRRQHLQLGIPCGENRHRLLDVAPQLAHSVIRAHIAKKESELVSANEQARLELSGVAEAPTV